jgi:hypothetical protein
MKKTVIAGCVAAGMLGASMNALANDSGAGNSYVLNLVGAGAMYQDFVPDIDGDGVDDPAICFDVDLVNLKNRQTVGTATDCLSDITPVGTGLALVGTTYFNFDEGQVVVRGKTTVQPALQPTVSASGVTMTHITGSASPDNGIIAGSGRFAGATGTTRLSGMVDMSAFDGNPGEPVAFDCVFVINLD